MFCHAELRLCEAVLSAADAKGRADPEVGTTYSLEAMVKRRPSLFEEAVVPDGDGNGRAKALRYCRSPVRLKPDTTYCGRPKVGTTYCVSGGNSGPNPRSLIPNPQSPIPNP